MESQSITILGVLVASIVGFMIGGVWYNVVFAKPWRDAAGVTKEKEASGNMVKTLSSAFALTVVMAIALSVIIRGDHSVLMGAGRGLTVGLGIVGSMLGIYYVFEFRPLNHWLINAGYAVAILTAMGAVISAFN